MTNKSMKNQILLTIILTLAASFIYAISSGIRNNYGIMFNAIIENTGLSYSYISLVLAFGQLFYGAIQPLCGITSKESSYAFALYGIITIIGSIISGSLCGKYKMKNVLGSFYGARVIIIILFLILPKTIFIIFGFAFLLGFTGMSTVPPVSGIINLKYGAKSIATLYGIVFFIHQIGAFWGAYLGGVLFERFLSYNPIWIINIILCIFASTVSFMIKD